MEDTQQQKSVFGLVQSAIYFFIILDVYTECFSFAQRSGVIIQRLNNTLYKMPILTDPVTSHLAVLGMTAIVAAAARSKKDIHFKASKHFIFPIIAGLITFFLSVKVLSFEIHDHIKEGIIYGTTYIIGTLFIHSAISNISKIITSGLGRDRWNRDQESFAQNTKLIETESNFNIPMQFYHQRKIQSGWININAFRAMMVIGTPGSGKSESVIVPFIKQFMKKGFSMLIYDFKYPNLSKIAYHHYNKNRANGGKLHAHNFHAINLDNVEQSERVNPLHSKYIRTLADASETAEAIINALTKTDKSSGSSQFFTQSAINFLAACIYYFARYENGKYSTLPHVLAFISMPYDKIFNTLFSTAELQALLAPFRSAYENKAFDQLEGQIGTVRVNISRIATKEAFWVFSGNDFDLKISNPKSIMVMANSPETQSINSAFYAVVLMRVVRLINSKGNHPSALVIDEAPTLFIHKIENLIATARSNKVAVALGVQELPQLYLQYGKEIANTITSIMGTVLSGAVRSKETLEWLEKLSGKIKQESNGISVNRNNTSVSVNERLEPIIPAAKIANLNAGEIVGIVARDHGASYEDYQPNIFNCKVSLDLHELENEKKHYKELPKFYTFGSEPEKTNFLLRNMQKIFQDVESILP
ncbi:MAG: type IV secretory system conjugative DNA transfer family protein [Segetibacter sp.]